TLFSYWTPIICCIRVASKGYWGRWNIVMRVLPIVCWKNSERSRVSEIRSRGIQLLCSTAISLMRWSYIESRHGKKPAGMLQICREWGGRILICGLESPELVVGACKFQKTWQGIAVRGVQCFKPLQIPMPTNCGPTSEQSIPRHSAFERAVNYYSSHS